MHQRFVSTPMDNKSVIYVSGIGLAYAKKLGQNGYTQASQLLVAYLQFQRNQQQFVNWLQQLTGGKPYYLNQAYCAMDEWYKQFGCLSQYQ